MDQVEEALGLSTSKAKLFKETVSNCGQIAAFSTSDLTANLAIQAPNLPWFPYPTSFTNYSGVSTNHQLRQNAPNSTFECTVCPKKYVRKYDLIKHCRKVHTEPLPFNQQLEPAHVDQTDDKLLTKASFTATSEVIEKVRKPYSLERPLFLNKQKARFKWRPVKKKPEHQSPLAAPDSSIPKADHFVPIFDEIESPEKLKTPEMSFQTINTLPNINDFPDSATELIPQLPHDTYKSTFQCTICFKLFTRKFNLNKHYRQLHNGPSNQLLAPVKLAQLDDKNELEPKPIQPTLSTVATFCIDPKSNLYQLTSVQAFPQSPTPNQPVTKVVPTTSFQNVGIFPTFKSSPVFATEPMQIESANEQLNEPNLVSEDTNHTMLIPVNNAIYRETLSNFNMAPSETYSFVNDEADSETIPDQTPQTSIVSQINPIDSPYPCDTCGKIFPTKCDLKKHKARHKSITCKFCNQVFTRKSDLNSHEKIHLIKQNRPNFKPFRCDICMKECLSYSSLTKHEQTHRKSSTQTQSGQQMSTAKHQLDLGGRFDFSGCDLLANIFFEPPKPDQPNPESIQPPNDPELNQIIDSILEEEFKQMPEQNLNSSATRTIPFQADQLNQFDPAMEDTYTAMDSVDDDVLNDLLSEKFPDRLDTIDDFDLLSYVDVDEKPDDAVGNALKMDQQSSSKPSGPDPASSSVQIENLNFTNLQNPISKNSKVIQIDQFHELLFNVPLSNAVNPIKTIEPPKESQTKFPATQNFDNLLNDFIKSHREEYQRKNPLISSRIFTRKVAQKPLIVIDKRFANLNPNDYLWICTNCTMYFTDVKQMFFHIYKTKHIGYHAKIPDDGEGLR